MAIVTPNEDGPGPVNPMTQTNNRFFDEVARLMNDAAGVAAGVRREFDTVMKTQAERILRDLEVVQRLRRACIDPRFSRKADDLRLAHRLLLLRRKQALSPPSRGASRMKDELNRISRLLATGALPAARQALQHREGISSSAGRAP